MRGQGGPTRVLMSHVGEHSSPVRAWELLLALVQVRAGQCSVGPGQNWAPPLFPAGLCLMTRLSLALFSHSAHFQGVSRARREGCGEAPELFPEPSWREALIGCRSRPSAALLPVPAKGLVFLCSLSINILALLF